MSMVKVCSYLLNSVQFQKYVEKQDKNGLKYKDPIGDPIVIEGINPYFARTKVQTPHVFTTILASDWEWIKGEMGHCSELKSGLIFAGKSDKETQLQAIGEVENVPSYGNEPTKKPGKGAKVVENPQV